MRSIRPTFERRQRLRQCLIKADAENLPDYELLQVMLFTSNPHADVELLVGELLDRFGSLAEVHPSGASLGENHAAPDARRLAGSLKRLRSRRWAA
jgi:DNA repair protein RadC